MTRTERKAIASKSTRKVFKQMMEKVIFTLVLFMVGVFSSVITEDASALFVTVFIVIPLVFTTRKIYIK